MLGQIDEHHPVLGSVTPRIKTIAVEANVGDETPDRALARVSALAEATNLTFRRLQDDALAVLSSEKGTLFVDVLDPRFWLVHTVSHSDFIRELVRISIWKSRDLDWCWMPRHIVERFKDVGAVEWFKTDFQGDELAPPNGQKARRLRAQLEGDDAYELLELIRTQYGSAAPLTALAIRLAEHGVGHVREIADYKGRFAGLGTSFELHVGLVSRLIQAYATYVRGIESRYSLSWQLQNDGGLSFDGEVIAMLFRRPVEDLDAFLAGLFSCRDPFRLWGVPRAVFPDFASVEAVDLHVGSHLRMDVSTAGLRVYLGRAGCGNSVARLLANLQHRYDATIETPHPN